MLDADQDEMYQSAA